MISHAHWDHTGDMSTFGTETDLIVGPGFKDHFLGGGKGNSTLGKVAASDVEYVVELIFPTHYSNNFTHCVD